MKTLCWPCWIGKQAVSSQSSIKRRALGDIGNDAKPRNQLSAKKAATPLGNATKKQSNPIRETIIDYDCEIEKPSFPLTGNE